MSRAKASREKKRQLGQFMTPNHIADRLVAALPLSVNDTILEPSMGDGSFIMPLIEKLLPQYHGSTAERLAAILSRNIFGVEIDPDLYDSCLRRIQSHFGFLPSTHNLRCADFFDVDFTSDTLVLDERDGCLSTQRRFSYIVGNPPFGGTIAAAKQDRLDRVLGFRNGHKIKKETYSFFIVKSLDLLAPHGRILFVCSDTFLSINTMKGLRELLMRNGASSIRVLDGYFDETKHPMVVLDYQLGNPGQVTVFGSSLAASSIRQTGNSSWLISEELSVLFSGPKLGDIFVATSGMTIGRNELFLRSIEANTIVEPYEFEFFDDPIRLQREVERARLGTLSQGLQQRIARQEAEGRTRRNVRWRERVVPQRIELPHPDYRYYNKARPELVYAPPTHSIFWRDDGDAVLTFKRNGNWYLHGVGGQPFFGREGLSWSLIAPRFTARYLPAGYILDSGAPCAFPRRHTDHEELYFVLGWLLTPLCNQIQKQVINHTRNIQSKDFERLPYPFWAVPQAKETVIRLVRDLIERARGGLTFTWSSPEILVLGEYFQPRELVSHDRPTVSHADGLS